MRYADIANKLGCTERQVRGWINNHCTKKNRDYKDSYFDVIDTPAKAYFLGFIYADGWITYRTVNCMNVGHEFAMQLQIRDRYILERLNSELGDAHIVTDSEKTITICNNKNESHTEFSILRVYSARIVRALIANGISSNKTYSKIYPTVDGELFSHFLRGYFDGDGCVSANSRGKAQVHFTAFGVSFLEYIQRVLSERYGIRSSIYACNERKHRLMLFRHDDVRAFCDLIYRDSANLRLERKYNKFVNLNGLAA